MAERQSPLIQGQVGGIEDRERRSGRLPQRAADPDHATIEQIMRARSKRAARSASSHGGVTPASLSIDHLGDIELTVRVILGRATLSIEEVLRLTEGSIIRLDTLAGEEVEVLVNEQLIARGEIVVVNSKFSVRITQIMDFAGE
jgi:flagellar motor switch protein FliN